MRELTEIATLFIGVSLVALLVGHSKGTSEVVTSIGSTFGKLLATVQLSGGYS